ncbi:MAG: winged helix-turn-helix transcriptional regulator [Candidatus Hadarchaeales archaeon]
MYRLRRSKAPEILLSLLKGPKHVRELQAEVKGSALTIEMRLKELIREGLVREREMKEWPFRRILELTPEGRRVAAILKLEVSAVSKPGKREREEVMERGKWILALLYSLGGAVEGSVRLQKLLFLLKRELGVDSLPYRFLPYLRGPYSEEIPDDVLELERAGLVRVERELLEPVFCSLTPEGEKMASELFNGLPEEIRKKMEELKKFNGMGLKELLEYVYSKYPEESKCV